jgi:4-carboxymuconolactone decarboxylase
VRAAARVFFSFEIHKEEFMSSIPTMGEVAPRLAEITNKILFGEVWERPGLSKRDRSLITVAVLMAGYRTDQLRLHLRKALEHGVSKTEISELITHVAFYGGWPTAANAVMVAKQVFEEGNPSKASEG